MATALVVSEINLHEVIKALRLLARTYPAERLSAYMMKDIDDSNDILIQRMCEYQKEKEKENDVPAN